MTFISFHLRWLLPTVEIRNQSQAEFEEKSIGALGNMHGYCMERVEQLAHHGGNLRFLAEGEGELQDLMYLAERMDRVDLNARRFADRRDRIELEILRRTLQER